MANGMDELAAAERRRDARLRKRALRLLSASRGSPLGSLSGRTIADMLDHGPADQRPTDDGHVINLLRDLVSWELASERDSRTRRHQVQTLDVLVYKITGKGQQLIDEAIPPVAGVDDERVMGGE